MTLDAAILEVVEREEIGDQSILLQRLAAMGQQVTQPTLSRHLKKLGIQKVAGLYRSVGKDVVNLPAFTLVEVSPCLLVLQTKPGYAQPISVLLDQNEVEGVAGTIAGDDTVFIAVDPKHQARLSRVAERVRTTLADLGSST